MVCPGERVLCPQQGHFSWPDAEHVGGGGGAPNGEIGNKRVFPEMKHLSLLL